MFNNLTNRCSILFLYWIDLFIREENQYKWFMHSYNVILIDPIFNKTEVLILETEEN